MLSPKAIAALGGVVLFGALGSAAFILRDAPGTDQGAGLASEIRGQTPNPQNDMMKPVGKTEADRRAGVNREAADAKAEKGKPYVAPTVITEKRGAQMGELPDVNLEPRLVEPPPEPKVIEKIIYQDRPVIQTVYRDVPVVPTADPEQVAAINDQIKALLKPTPGGFLVRSFTKGERPKPPEPRPAAVAPWRVPATSPTRCSIAVSAPTIRQLRSLPPSSTSTNVSSPGRSTGSGCSARSSTRRRRPRSGSPP
jgi:hypothetical protein